MEDIHQAATSLVQSLSSPQQGSRSENAPSFLMERAKLLFGSYRKGQADDPDIYVAAITAVLSEYPPDVVIYVTDPRTGIQQRCKWLPDVPEVREACEAAMEPRYRAQREAQHRADRERQAAEEAERAAHPRPTAEEIAQKLGRPIGERPQAPVPPLVEVVEGYGVRVAAALGQAPAPESPAVKAFRERRGVK